MYDCAMRLFRNQINIGQGRSFLDVSTQTGGKRKEKRRWAGGTHRLTSGSTLMVTVQ